MKHLYEVFEKKTNINTWVVLKRLSKKTILHTNWRYVEMKQI